MKKPDTSLIDQEWPADELEEVHNCPFCGSAERTIAYENVQDWSFYCAPGKWAYWNCKGCETLYLSPRPSEASIGKAYTTYYTHVTDDGGKLTHNNFYKLTRMVKNGYLNKTLHAQNTGTVTFPNWIYNFLGGIGLLPRTPLHDISRRLPGRMLDIGSGSGKLLKFAKQLGWDVVGVELDENAVKTSRAEGLNVVHGSLAEIGKLSQQFDLIVCSHVLEHVYDPSLLIESSLSRLAPDGELWIQWPNPQAEGLKLFGCNWRGLEAPRHIAIPSLDAVKNLVGKINPEFKVLNQSTHWLWSQMSMYASSKAIQNKEFPPTSGMTIRSLARYVTSRWNIKQCELCVVTIKR